MKDRFRGGEFFRNMKSVITIHNLKFQGVWDVKTIQRFSGLPDYYFTPDKLEAYKDGNMLKGGIVFADAITTVSDTYAEEIKMPFYGEGLDGLMRARAGSLRGIVNGIDYEEFNPETDSCIVQNYNARNFRKEKIKNKRALQEELGLVQDDKKMMIGIVSRLTDQKGLDLIQYVMDDLCNDDIQLVVLGTGDERYENMFRHYDWKYPVSYTHLDVYKRQTQSHRPIELIGNCKRESKRCPWTRRAVCGRLTSAVSRLRNWKMPVSYTHLDVYKRQIPLWPSSATAPSPAAWPTRR